MDLRKRLVKYCTTPGGEACKIIHGDPGCGKSGLLAAVADVSVKITEMKDDFIFIHIVDCSAGSSSLEKAIRRCYDELLDWRRKHAVKDNSQPDFTQNYKDVEDIDRGISFLCKIFDETKNKLTAKNFASLKNDFLAFIYNTAEAYPGANFSFIFDAVNQFSSEKDAYSMWWIPQKNTEVPENVNFVISTLSTESGTFENARSASSAGIIKIESMPDSDLVKLLERTLAQYNKKLTIKQLTNIVKRASKSPLFLTALCSDIRRAGIWEEVDLEIEKLILTSSETLVELKELLDRKQEIHNIQLSHEEQNEILSKGARSV